MAEQHPPRCSRYTVDDLSRYMVGALAPRRQKQVEQHLAGCPHCRRRLQELAAVQAALRHTPAAPLPRSFTLPASVARLPRRQLWYPTLRTATAAAAMLVLIVLLGGVLQPGLWGDSAPAPRPLGVKATPLIVPTPLPVAIAPASTWRPRPTPANAAPHIEEAPTAEAPGYPQPADMEPRIEATVARPAGAAAPPRAASVGATLWSAIHLGALAVLGVLAGLTWLAYRRERLFFS